MPTTPETADELIRRHAWEEASRLLDATPDQSLTPRLQRNLARNMAALRRARPDEYEQIVRSPDTGACAVVQLPSGALTISRRLPDGRSICLSAGPDPAAALAQQRSQLEPSLAGTGTLALCQLGDGALLSWLASRPEATTMSSDWRRTAYLIEPDIEALSRLLALHDFTGPDGPIENDRFRWFLGPEWEARLRRAVDADPFLVFPSVVVRMGICAPAIAEGLLRISRSLETEEEELGRRASRYYEAQPRAAIESLLGDAPPRPPRILFLTSRFTTVLQYSVRDTAEAFERLGWQTLTLIEPSPHHALTTLAMRRTLLDFKPDVVFTIDHLRNEAGRIFPESLPFMCWIQDDLPHLTSREAAASVGRRDFILTCAEDHYFITLGYPRRQCIHLEKLTRLPRLPERWQSDGDDLVFVSNASQQPGHIVEQLARESAASPALAERIRLCGRKLIQHYASGGQVATVQQLGRFFAAAEKEAGGPPLPAQNRHQVALRLFNGLNNALYRQQALRWVAEAANKRGLSLVIYGRGWADNPEFSAYAKGYVSYGPDLERLTRSAKINLQIVPFSCLHQRLLDGWAAGGFFLVRAHEIEMLWLEWADIVDNLVPPDVHTTLQARLTLQQSDLERFDALTARLVREVDAGPKADDMVASFRRLRGEQGRTSLVRPPRLDDVLFTSSREVGARIDGFIADEPLRREITLEQRGFVEQSFTYEAGMRRVMRRVASLVAAEEPAWFGSAIAETARGAA
ncbi:MAG: hypothetical protein K8S99_18550 [Planctomycetes bacterium]|nr:hypothetical protein [Planctomycetota bacterium]